MKKIITKIILTLILVTSIIFVIPTSYTNAAGPTGSGVKTGEVSNDSGVLSKIFAFSSLPDLFNSALANMANGAMAGAGMLLSMSAYLLDVSIRLTLNIKTFVDSTPVIYSVWRILRDITGLFFIFYLIYAAIQMIIGIGNGPSYGATIKSIIIAGVLINFSFFFVSVAIDFSNVLSQTIYRAMVPNTKVLSINPNTGISTLVAEAGSSNISNIFMNSLRIQNIYDTNGNKLGTRISDPVSIALIGLAGVIMMITTAASFALASLAFIARFIILIFLLAFSSLWFVAGVIPQIKKHLSFEKYLFDQLIFMPVYLLLMYVGLSIVNGSNLLLGADNTFNTLPTGTNWLMPYIILAVNFTIVIAILNLPLVVALGMGGHATNWFKSSIGKWDAKGVWKNVGMWTKDRAANVPRSTIGAGASAFKKSATFGKIATISPTIGVAASKGLSKVSSASFGGKKGGYDADLKQTKKDLSALHKDLGDNKTVGKDNQVKFRESLKNGLHGRLLSRKAYRETADELNKKAKKEEDKKAKPVKVKRLKEIDAKLKEIENSSRTVTGFSLAGAQESENRDAEKKSLLEEKEKIQDEISEIENNEREEREKAILSRFDKLEEKNESKGQGDK